MTATRSPGGAAAPAVVVVDGRSLELEPLATEVARRYRDEFPDERDRYGDAGLEWCVHDNQYLIAWAVEDATLGSVSFPEQVGWLARVLAARGYPLERLVRDIEIIGAVLAQREPELARAIEATLAAGADVARAGSGVRAG